ncbi:hypothetical protein ACFUCV_07000 [Specibacter sp. NPDC057265]|uniref:hypothetical protein n=1 Tax=Specibacter sp. NPDC057265 TaxID=3346075 RepID=UPI0036380E0A
MSYTKAGEKMKRKNPNHVAIPMAPGFAAVPGPVNPAVKVAAGAAFDAQGKPVPALQNMLLKAVEVQRPLVLGNLRRLRARHPHATAHELSRRLEKEFLAGMGTGGAAIGATAIIPGVGTLAALGISAAATGVFLEATALYAQSVAELHGVRLQDPESAQLMVMAIILGDEGLSMLQGLTGQALGKGKTPMHAWGRNATKSMPMTAAKGVMAPMRKMFLKKMAARSGASMVGKAMPFGIGAAIGGVGNYMMGKAVIASAQHAFGPAPLEIPPLLLAELESGRRLPKAPRIPKAKPPKIKAAKKPGRGGH